MMNFQRSNLPAVVLGGGFLGEDFDHGAIIVACNNHWVGKCIPDYVCYLDNPKFNDDISSALSVYRGVTVGRHPYCGKNPDHVVTNKWLTEMGITDTGGLAIWVAKRISGSVTLVGFDRHKL